MTTRSKCRVSGFTRAVGWISLRSRAIETINGHPLGLGGGASRATLWVWSLATFRGGDTKFLRCFSYDSLVRKMGIIQDIRNEEESTTVAKYISNHLGRRTELGKRTSDINLALHLDFPQANLFWYEYILDISSLLAIRKGTLISSAR